MEERIKHIIESGMLERYLLGNCTEEQTQEIETLLENSAKLKKYFKEMSEDQFAITESKGKAGPLKRDEKDRVDIVASEYASSSFKNSKGIKKSSMTFERVVLIAAIFCMFISLFTAFNLFMKNLELQRSLDRSTHLYKEHDFFTRQLNMQLDLLQMVVVKLEDQIKILDDSQTKKVRLKGNDKAHRLDLNVYWNDEKKVSLLTLKNIPQLTDDECFQIWASKQGEFLDLGILNRQDYIMEIKNFEDAKSLIITIEPEGGSQQPTMANIVSRSAI